MAKNSPHLTAVPQVMKELKRVGNEQTARTFRNHGADGDIYGVKVGDLKKVQKRIGNNQELAIELWETGNSDAMYLAGLIADGAQMNRRQLNGWAKSAWWYMLSEHSVPSVAAMHADAFPIATKWIGQKSPSIRCSGWCTHALALAVRSDDQIPMEEVSDLISDIKSGIHDAPNRVRYCMNSYLISVGSYIEPLLDVAKEAAARIGKVSVDTGGTACKVPLETEYIEKDEQMGRVGKKRNSTKC